MFNVAVVRLRDLLKYIVYIIIIFTIIFFGKKFLNQKKSRSLNIGQQLANMFGNYIEEAVNMELPAINTIKKQSNNNLDINEDNKDFENKVLIGLLNIELPELNINEKEIESSQKVDDSIVNDIKEIETSIIENETQEEITTDIEKDTNNQDLELAKTDVKTEVITKNPLADSFTKRYKGVKIKNETTFDLSDELLNYDNLKIDKSKVIIFHTHTCESYTSSKTYSYVPTGKYRTTDLNYSVARVGDELSSYLEKYGIDVDHNKTYHDYPAYNGSYSRSLATITKILKSSNADIIIDLHRDAIGSNSEYAPTVMIGEDNCAQLMFVIGTNGGGLNHPNWKYNLQFAVKIQDLANKKYPGLFKPIIVRNSRYNQHLGKAACIIEVGATRKHS